MLVKKIVKYETLSFHFKRRITLVYSNDFVNSIIEIHVEGLPTRAIEIWYEGIDYIILLNDRNFALMEWDAIHEIECEENVDSFIHSNCTKTVIEDLESLFYS